jgi:hypothetical protein
MANIIRQNNNSFLNVILSFLLPLFGTETITKPLFCPPRLQVRARVYIELFIFVSKKSSLLLPSSSSYATTCLAPVRQPVKVRQAASGAQ